MKEPLTSDNSGQIQNVVFGVILILLFILVCQLLSPFFTVLLWSCMFYVILSPLYRKIVKNLDFTKRGDAIIRQVLAAGFAIGSVILILVPLTFVGSQFFRQIVELIRLIRDTFTSNPDMLTDIFAHASELIEDLSAGQIIINPISIQRQIITMLSSSLQNLLQLSSNIAMNIGNFLFSLVLMVFSLFFFYMDGAYLSGLLLRAIPIRKEYLTALVQKFSDITRNLVLGYIMVALVQAVMGFIVFTIFQVKGALVFAVLTFVCVFIPMVGGSLVWFPLGLLRIINGDILGGVIFWIVSGFFISLLDNFVRPMFLQDRIQLHPLIIFFSILGGLSVFGANGLILGPMLVILFLTVLDLFLTEHKMADKDTMGIKNVAEGDIQ
ncbi:MAG: AI-2E family transporter [Treponema sp.]|jgi:predicted PurR-regulated permease PerM|nr:AI-2E family transporter [Treponema sp.]